MTSQAHVYCSLPDASRLHSCPASSTMSCSVSSPPRSENHTTAIRSRPKLTLQTSSLPRSCGSSTTGLSFSRAAGSGASPTVRNTFKNAYDVPSPSSATTSPSKASSGRFGHGKPASTHILHPNSSHHHSPFAYRSPYQLPLGVRSILRNSPLDAASRRRSGSISAAGSSAGGAGVRRMLFPAKKQVSYRHPLEEEIRTVRYTAQHVDLMIDEAARDEGDANRDPEDPAADFPSEDEDDSDACSASLSESSASSSETSAGNDDGAREPSLSTMERKRRRTMRFDRQVRAVALLDGLEPDSYGSSTPQTPRQPRVKRRREWKWTLGPVDPVPPPDTVTGPGPPPSPVHRGAEYNSDLSAPA